MGDGNMVALEIVIDVDLPVARDEVIAPLRQMQAVELESAGLLRNLPEESPERFGIPVEIHEDELFPNFAAQRDHAHRGAIKELHAVHVRRAEKTPIEGVGPAMVLAAQHIFAAAP